MALFGAARISATSEIDRVLKALPDKTRRNVTRGAVSKAARIVVKEMKARAPVGPTGNLKASIGQIGVRDPGPQKLTRQVGALKGKGTRFKGYHAHLVEFGTSVAAPHPFIRPAWDATRNEALKVIGISLGKGVEKQALKLAGSFAKSGLKASRRRRR